MAFPFDYPAPQIRASEWPWLHLRQVAPDPHTGYPIIEFRKRLEIGPAHPLNAALAELRTPFVLAIVHEAHAWRNGEPVGGTVCVRRNGGQVLIGQGSQPEHATLEAGDVVELHITGEGTLINDC